MSLTPVSLLLSRSDDLVRLEALAREAGAVLAGTGLVDRLCFGNEFCQYLIPSPAEVQRARALAVAHGLGFSLATPYVPDRGLDLLRELLPLLEPGDEVVVNDWGVLRVVAREHPRLVVVAGRLLNKILRDHRTTQGPIPALDPARAAPADQALASTGLASAAMAALLIRLGVRRIEFDWGPRGFLWDVPQIAASVHLPFGYVASGRVCPSASLDRPPPEKFTVDPESCPRPCRRFRIELWPPFARTPLLHVGNTVFFEVSAAARGEALAAIARQPGGRIVWQPVIPM